MCVRYRYPSDFSSRRHGQQHTNTNTHTHTHSSSNSHPQGGLNGTQGGPGPTPLTSPLLSPPTPAPSSLPHSGSHNTVTSYGPIPTPTPLDCLKVIVHYLKREEKEKILRLLFENSPPIIKFKKFNYRCRILISEKDCLKKVLLNGSFGALQDGMQGLSSEEKDATGTIWDYHTYTHSPSLSHSLTHTHTYTLPPFTALYYLHLPSLTFTPSYLFSISVPHISYHLT